MLGSHAQSVGVLTLITEMPDAAFLETRRPVMTTQKMGSQCVELVNSCRGVCCLAR